MKKILVFVAFVLALFQLSAQKDINWVKIDSPKDDYVFKFFYKYTDNTYKAVFTIPNVKPFQPVKNQIFVRTFNADLSDYTEQNIPSEAPYLLNITGFQNYTVISGSTDENKNPMMQFRADNKLVVTDAQLNPLLNVSYSVHGKKHRFVGEPSVYKSADSSHLIIINTEIMTPDKPSLKEPPRMHFIEVYDKDLQLVWKDSVNFEKIFGEGIPLNNFDIDYLNNHLYIFASHRTVPTKKVKATLYFVRYDQPQSYKIIDKQIMMYDQFNWKFLITKQGKLIMSGVNYVTNSGSKKQLFFITLDLNEADAQPKVKTFPIDKTFIAKYPQYKGILTLYFAYPSDLILTPDGIVYVGEYHEAVTRTSSSGSYSSSSTTYYCKPITFIKFDMNGNIVWLKAIEKYIASKTTYFPYFCRSFTHNNKVVVFYYDYLDNIFKDKYKGKLMFVSDTKLCLAKAEINAEGNITKSLIYNIGEGGKVANLLTLRQIDNDRYFIAGASIGFNPKNRGDYAAIYSLGE